MYQVGDKVVATVEGEVTKVEKNLDGTVEYLVKSTGKGKTVMAWGYEGNLKPLAKEE